SLVLGVAFFRALLLVIGLFWFVALIFLLAAAPVGWLFDRLPPLTAYSADLLGSLFGVLALTALAALGTSPMAWMALIVLPLLWIAPGRIPLSAGCLVVLFAALSTRGAQFSPYNRLDLSHLSTGDAGDRGRDWILRQNRDFSQEIYDLS